MVFVLSLYKMFQGIAKFAGRFKPTPGATGTHKNVFWAPQWGFGDTVPYCIQKPSKKHQNLTSVG
jgi:hypothetical protein